MSNRTIYAPLAHIWSGRGAACSLLFCADIILFCCCCVQFVYIIFSIRCFASTNYAHLLFVDCDPMQRLKSLRVSKQVYQRSKMKEHKNRYRMLVGLRITLAFSFERDDIIMNQ